MPKYDHSDFSDVQNHLFAKGIITSVDSENDLADVTVAGYQDGSDVPLFYHCEPDSEERSNGAIYGAAAAFSVDDEVIVMCTADGAPVRIVGFVEGIKSCLWEPFTDSICAAGNDWFYMGPESVPHQCSVTGISTPIAENHIFGGSALLDFDTDDGGKVLVRSTGYGGDSTFIWNVYRTDDAIPLGNGTLTIKALTSMTNATTDASWISMSIYGSGGGSGLLAELIFLAGPGFIPGANQYVIGTCDGTDREIALADYGIAEDVKKITFTCATDSFAGSTTVSEITIWNINIG